MKTNLLKKFKWYIVGFIMIVIVLGVGLSFCSWDDYSLKSVNTNGQTGSYTTWASVIKGTRGETLTVQPKMGDIVQYGRFWQKSNAIGEEMLDPLCWIIVDIDDKNVATLLSEKVVVLGNFWGNRAYYQNYYQSTLRAWLNSGRESVISTGNNWTLGDVATKEGDENWRDDAIGSQFSGEATNQVNKGFLDIAFNSEEQFLLVPKKMEDIRGYGKNTFSGGSNLYSTRNSNKSINDLVWVPSWSEIYGTTNTKWGSTTDGSPSGQFQYYKSKVAYNISNPMLLAYGTDYAWNTKTNSYYNNGNGVVNDSYTARWWWLRSPMPGDYTSELVVTYDGSGTNAFTFHPDGGVRPAVCVQL